MATLRDWVVSLDVKEAELSSKLESSQTGSSLGVEGDANDQVLGFAYSTHQALNISKYLCSDTHRRREGFELSHYAHDGFVRAQMEVAVLYPELDLSSLYWPS
ncbi:hypothetical protein ACLOJK_020748 [Asimina triloba]